MVKREVGIGKKRRESTKRDGRVRGGGWREPERRECTHQQRG